VSFPAEYYADFLLNHPSIALNFIRMLGARLQTIMTMNTLTGERVERRIAHILLKLAARAGRADAEGIMVSIPLSRQDLADMSGTTLETTIRVMSRFRADGWIKTRRGGYVVICDKESLQNLARMET
jgi:CRP-like cAMP-binding protein